MACFRCGRKSHYANNCFAKTTIRGVVIESDNDSYSEQSEEEEYVKKRKRASNSNPTTISRARAGIYVLKAASGLYYVGKSNDIRARIQEHQRGFGAVCLAGESVHEVSGLLTSGSTADLESWERNETLQRMLTHGIDHVRGWMFTATVLSDEDRSDAFRQICEKFDLCRRCGRESHFSGQCFAKSGAAWAGSLAPLL
jgi:predicted GIY-YIG superfamily endonuclease